MLSSLGYEVSRVNIIHIDSTYTRDETLELEKLFCVQDITEQVKQKQRDIPQILNKFDEILSQNNGQALISVLIAQVLIPATLGSTAGISSELSRSIVYLTSLV